MKDVSTTLRSTISTLLTGNITYQSKTVKVFSDPPKSNEIPIKKGALYHYIEIGDISDVETPRNADTFCHDVALDIQVVVGFPGKGSKVVPDSIANQIMQLVQPTKGGSLDLGSDFDNIYIVKEIDFTTYESDIHNKHIKTIRYRLEIDET